MEGIEGSSQLSHLVGSDRRHRVSKSYKTFCLRTSFQYLQLLRGKFERRCKQPESL
jgi:hypothetical protein